MKWFDFANFKLHTHSPRTHHSESITTRIRSSKCKLNKWLFAQSRNCEGTYTRRIDECNLCMQDAVLVLREFSTICRHHIWHLVNSVCHPEFARSISLSLFILAAWSTLSVPHQTSKRYAYTVYTSKSVTISQVSNTFSNRMTKMSAAVIFYRARSGNVQCIISRIFRKVWTIISISTHYYNQT